MTCRVETREDGPDFQRNTLPEASGPSMLTDFTSGFHEGQEATSEMTAQTVSGGAAIWSWPSAVAGAFLSMSKEATLYAGNAGDRTSAPADLRGDRGARALHLHGYPLCTFHTGNVGLLRRLGQVHAASVE